MYKLTINDRILLHLLDNSSSRLEREAPLSITQKGIAEGVGIRWNHVPRAMMKLKKMGYVQDEMSHIQGKTRRQKAYFLTDDGMLFARNLRERMMAWKVHLKKPDGQVVGMRLSEVNSALKTNFSPLAIFNNINKSGVVESENLLEHVELETKRPTTKLYSVKGEMVWPDEIVGRESEINSISEFLDSSAVGTVVIYGSVGIGKSALMAHVLKGYSDTKNILWYQMSENDLQTEILRSISEFLTQLGQKGLSKYIEEHEKIDLSETLRIMEKGFSGHSIILAFDNYFEVSEDVADFFSGLCTLAAKIPDLTLFIGARDTTPFYCRFYDKNEVKKKRIAEVTLKGLDKEGIKRMLDTPNIDDDALKKIDLMTRGHPLTIELIKKGDVLSLKRIKGFSRQEASLLLYLKTVEK
jgi:DNA-binding MarR family transcriptional regulator